VLKGSRPSAIESGGTYGKSKKDGGTNIANANERSGHRTSTRGIDHGD